MKNGKRSDSLPKETGPPKELITIDQIDQLITELDDDFIRALSEEYDEPLDYSDVLEPTIFGQWLIPLLLGEFIVLTIAIVLWIVWLSDR